MADYSVFRLDEVELIDDGFQQLDTDPAWREWEPEFQWLPEELEEFQREEQHYRNWLEAMAWWWDDEGVWCWTFGPPRNPYRAALENQSNVQRRERADRRTSDVHLARGLRADRHR